MSYNHSKSIFLGDIPIGKSFFFRIENALLISNKDDIIEIVSFYNNLENDLKSYCIFKGEIFLDTNFKYIFQNSPHLSWQGVEPWT